MSKTKKILLAIFIPLIACIVIAGFVLYVLYPLETKQIAYQVWDWLNAPLPLIGISALALIIIVWKVIASTSFGKKKYKELKKDYETLKVEYEKKTKMLETWNGHLENYYKGTQDNIDYLYGVIIEICKATPNKNVKQIGEKLYGEEREETLNSETTEN